MAHHNDASAALQKAIDGLQQNLRELQQALQEVLREKKKLEENSDKVMSEKFDIGEAKEKMRDIASFYHAAALRSTYASGEGRVDVMVDKLMQAATDQLKSYFAAEDSEKSLDLASRLSTGSDDEVTKYLEADTWGKSITYVDPKDAKMINDSYQKHRRDYPEFAAYDDMLTAEFEKDVSAARVKQRKAQRKDGVRFILK